MATDNLQALFGGTMLPQDMQQELINQRAQQFAQLTPSQQLSSMGYKTGAAIGGGLAQAMGVDITDPRIKRQSQLQALSQGVESTPEGLKAFAQKLQANGFAAEAAMAMDKAISMEKEQSIIAKNLRTRPEKESELAMLQAERDAIVTQFGENDPRVKQYDARIAKITKGGGIGSEIAAGLAPLVGAISVAQAKKMGEAGGTDVGKQTAAVQGKYTALGSIKDAVDMLDKGIYSGGYGPTQELAAKYGAGLIKKDRLANTQEFRAYIGDVVIPRLQEFGGNDSVEELNYLRSVMAGDTSMEGAAIKNILKKADGKIRAGIDRLEKQQQAIGKGEMLPVGAINKPPAQKATKRWNPATNQLETVQ